MKKLLLIIPLIVVLVVFGLWVKTKIIAPVHNNAPITQAESSQSTSTPDLCGLKDSVKYYYYDGSDPNWKNNNKFGIYIYPENDSFFELAQNLVNSNGGDWGYVLIPYNMKDRDETKWSGVFDMLKKKHLIPIIQLYSLDPANYKKQTPLAAKFLDSFLWPIKYRYISVYNEPNDSKFWGGDVNPSEYAKVLNFTIDTFKNENENYFMLNGALNISTTSTDSNMDAFEFMHQMNVAFPGIFNKLDGWASHPYPQPNFSGNPTATGRMSIRAYESELNYLKTSAGLEKTLPVFITETGWAHAEGENYDGSYLPLDTVTQYYKEAYTDVWLKDDRVRAVIPFTIWYEPPFDHFAWVNRDRVPYKHYEAIKKLNKVKGKPPVLKTTEAQISGC